MRKSIYFKNFISTAVIMLMSFVILGAMFIMWSYRIIISSNRDAMSHTAGEARRYFASQSNSVSFSLSSLDTKILLSAMSGISGYGILVADTDGLVINCSDPQLFCPHIGRPVPQEVLASLSSGSVFSKTTELGGVFRERRYTVGEALTADTRQGSALIGYVFISSELRSTADIWRQFVGVFILIAIFVMILTFIISLITTKKQAEPLNDMAQAAHRFARGDFSARAADTEREDEIGQLIRALNNMADSMERSETLRREFVANVSHELKTPMTTIAGFADGILDGTIPRENEAKYLEIISSETHRLSRLVRGMLDMSQLQSADMSKVTRGRFDISEVLRVTLLSLSGKIEQRGLDVAALLPEEPLITRGDKDSITQIAYNLIDNAIKFSNPGSTIRLKACKKGAKAYVSVENTGETIPESEMRNIFDRFHKLDKSRSRNKDGVGLGLYIVKTILDNHNEDIYVTSADGVTRFEFTLALAEK